MTKEMCNDFMDYVTFWQFDMLISEIKKYGTINNNYDNINKFNQTVGPLLGTNCNVLGEFLYFKKQTDNKRHIYNKKPITGFYDATEFFHTTSGNSIYIKTTLLVAFIRFGGIVKIDGDYYNDGDDLFELLKRTVKSK